MELSLLDLATTIVDAIQLTRQIDAQYVWAQDIIFIQDWVYVGPRS